MSGYEFDNPKLPLCANENIKMKYMGDQDIKTPSVPCGNSKNEAKLTLGQKIDYRRELILRRRHIVDTEFTLAMIGIILMVVETELFITYGMEKVSIASITLKTIISATTVILLICICLNYYTAAKIKMLDAGLKEWHMAMSTWNWFGLALELLICSIHPFPGDVRLPYLSPDGVSHTVSLDAVLSIVMVARLYLVAKFAVVHSVLLTDTSIYSIGALSKVKINTLFVFRAAMRNRPGQLLLLVMISTFVVNTWAMRACELYYERKNYNKNSYIESMWLIAITFLTVGYGDRTPQSYCGRYISIVTGAMGVITTALLVAIIARYLQQTRSEKYVFNFVSRLQIVYRKKTAAANAIKAVLRLQILRRYGDEFKGEIRKYEDKLKKALQEIKSAKEDMDHIGDDAVGILDVAHSVDKIVNELDRKFAEDKENRERMQIIDHRLDSIETKLNSLCDLMSQKSK
ncbi:small conductance calcium-activated potassium channel protein 2-like [Saccostrea cucullata]|uniref:small conductance calcium-activated potassium channel protein 2-like n=1 Tax=Saccostrea cuccullata TaxID=36930 RepID=UPI002ED1441D